MAAVGSQEAAILPQGCWPGPGMAAPISHGDIGKRECRPLLDAEQKTAGVAPACRIDRETNRPAKVLPVGGLHKR